MSGNTIVLILAGVTAALLVLGLAQLVVALMPSDERRVKERLASARGAAGPQASGPIVRARTESRVNPHTSTGRFERRMQLIFPRATVGSFLAISLGCGGVVGVLVTLLLGVVAGVGAGLIPLLILNYKRAERERILGEQLIEALDFLARILRAGHSLATGLKMCGEELPEPIAGEFARGYDQHTLGQSIEDALTAMAGRLDLPDFNFFVTSVVIQRQTGGDLAEILDNIAKMVRSRIQLKMQVRALTSEGRATGAVLTALPLIIFVAMMILNPKYVSVLLTTGTGQVMTAVSIVLIVVGQLMIRRIVTIKV
jgi:tight adherence protein B